MLSDVRPARASAVLRLLAVVSALVACAPDAAAAAVPEGVTWTQEYFPTPDGETLHADVLWPKGLSKDEKTPVLLVVGPYSGRSGQLGVSGAPAYDPTADSPPSRFDDFFVGQQVWKKGYTVVYVDLRGFGGSTGCHDLLGPGDRTDVRTAVRWAATRSWSTGRVGMYGKSYDAITGLMGVADQPKGLAAVVAMQGLTDAYDATYAQGVRRAAALLFPLVTYSYGDSAPTTASSPQYVQNAEGTSFVQCQERLQDQYQGDEKLAYWRERNFTESAATSTVPTFITTGHLDENVVPQSQPYELFKRLRGPKRAWIGWWDHIRGTDKNADGSPRTGRAGFAEEAMRWLDRYVKRVPAEQARVEDDPAVAVQSGPEGRWRTEAVWPPVDVVPLSAPLRGGTFTDDGTGLGNADGSTSGQFYVGPPVQQAGKGAWTFSPPLEHAAHLAGEPRADLRFAPGSNPKAAAFGAVYDVSQQGDATLISRGAQLVGRGGRQALRMSSMDWRVPAGHRLAVLVGGGQAESNYAHVPTGSMVTFTGGTVTLPFLRRLRVDNLDGTASARLKTYVVNAPIGVPAKVVAGAIEPAWPQPVVQTAPASRRGAARLTVLLRRDDTRGRFVVSGRAPTGARLTVELRRGSKLVARHTVRRVSGGRYRLVLRAPATGPRLRARVVSHHRGDVQVVRSEG